MKFGVPNQRPARKVELFPNTPVLTIEIDGGKGTSRAMTLNSKAVEMLGLGENNATIAFAFEDKQVFITNGNQESIPDEYKIRVTKGNPRKISEKRTYTYLSEKIFELDNSVANHLELVKVENPEAVEFNAFELTQMSGSDELTDVKEEVKSIPSVDEMTQAFAEEPIMEAGEFIPSVED